MNINLSFSKGVFSIDGLCSYPFILSGQINSNAKLSDGLAIF